MNDKNLKPWQPGTSGNPNGRPKGSRSIKKVVQDLLTDKKTFAKLSISPSQDTQTPLEAIICTLMVKSIRGDVRASEVLLKYAIDRDMPVDEGGFFSKNELTIKVVGPEYH